MKPTEAAKLRRELIDAMDYASDKLVKFCKPYRGDMGLVSDECKNSAEYKCLNSAYQIAKSTLAVFNKHHRGVEYTKAFRAETIEYFNQKRK